MLDGSCICCPRVKGLVHMEQALKPGLTDSEAILHTALDYIEG